MKKTTRTILLISTITLSSTAMATGSSQRPPETDTQSTQNMTVWDTLANWFDSWS